MKNIFMLIINPDNITNSIKFEKYKSEIICFENKKNSLNYIKGMEDNIIK
jgi:hypothetical protein